MSFLNFKETLKCYVILSSLTKKKLKQIQANQRNQRLPNTKTRINCLLQWNVFFSWIAHACRIAIYLVIIAPEDGRCVCVNHNWFYCCFQRHTCCWFDLIFCPIHSMKHLWEWVDFQCDWLERTLIHDVLHEWFSHITGKRLQLIVQELAKNA